MACCNKYTNGCCPNHKECYRVDYRELETLSYNISVELCRLADLKLNNLLYKYKCKPDTVNRFKTLERYKDTIDRFRQNLLKGYKTCLDECQLQTLKEKILDYIPRLQKGCRLDCIVDDSNAEAWIAGNPGCISREPYEKLKYYTCTPLNLTATIVEEKKECEDITFKASIITQEECELKWKQAIRESKCSMSYEVYAQALECGIDHNYIVDTYKCGHTISFNTELQKCEINFNTSIKNKTDKEC